MAKNYIIVLYFLFFALHFNGISQNLDSRSLIARPSEKQLQVKKVYDSYVGIKELTGHNDGKEVERILASCKLKKGNPWCAASVCSSFIDAGIKAIISGYCPDWFKPKYVIWTKGKGLTPQTADVFGIFFPKLGRIAHEGFVDKWEYGTAFFISAEGNANNKLSREGNCFCKNRRLKTNVYKVSRYI